MRIRMVSCTVHRTYGQLTRTDEFNNIMAVNTSGPYYLARSLVRSWLDLPIALPAATSASSGHSTATTLDVPNMKNVNLNKQILFVSSISGLVAMAPQRQAAYNASKGALTMLSKVSPLGLQTLRGVAETS
jgi:sorbose reductase